MMSLLERIAWYRAEQYLGRYLPYTIAVAGTYGRENAAEAIAHAIRSQRHVRSGYPALHSIDIPEGILGAKSHKEHGSILRMLTQEKMRELTHFEPTTIISQVPLMKPHFAPWALSRIVPRMLVLTHVGLEHMDLFINKDMVAHEYGILAHTLEKDALVILNLDDKDLLELHPKIKNSCITYGLHPSADIRISRATRAEGNKGLFLEVILHGTHHELFLPHLFAKQHITAVAAALAAAHGLGISMQDAIAGLKLMKPQTGRLSRENGINNSTIIDDSYDTCPEQLESSLKSFATLTCSGRKIAVLGDMDDLASFAIEKHEEAGKQVASIAPICIFVGDMMRHGQDAALKSGVKIDTHHFESSHEVTTWLPEHVRGGDMVFVSGGKSMQMGKIVQDLRR